MDKGRVQVMRVRERVHLPLDSTSSRVVYAFRHAKVVCRFVTSVSVLLRVSKGTFP